MLLINDTKFPHSSMHLYKAWRVQGKISPSIDLLYPTLESLQWPAGAEVFVGCQGWINKSERFQVKVCQELKQEHHCQLLRFKWGRRSPVSFSKCNPDDTAQGRLALEVSISTENPQSLQGSLEMLPEQILWQMHIWISFCNGFFFLLTSCMQKSV